MNTTAPTLSSSSASSKNICMVHFAEKDHGLLVKILSSLQSPFLLLIRLYWGWQFAVTGWGKLTNLERVTGFFTSLHIPFPHLNAIMAGSTECFGGLLILLGLASRPAALALSFTMLIAYVTADREALFSIFTDTEAFYKADPYTFLFAAVLIAIFGPGKLSVDAWLASRFQKSSAVRG